MIPITAARILSKVMRRHSPAPRAVLRPLRDRGGYDDRRLNGGPYDSSYRDNGYRDRECRWGEIIVRDRDGYPERDRAWAMPWPRRRMAPVPLLTELPTSQSPYAPVETPGRFSFRCRLSEIRCRTLPGQACAASDEPGPMDRPNFAASSVRTNGPRIACVRGASSASRESETRDCRRRQG